MEYRILLSTEKNENSSRRGLMLNLKSKIREIPDWPKKGVIFRDITPLLEEPRYFKEAIKQMVKPWKNKKIDKVVGIDARGFLLAAPIAVALNAGLVIVRKKGKLPHKTIACEYDLEYNKETIEIHRDSIKEGERVLIVDDVLATGGTSRACAELADKLKGEIVGISFLIELDFLNGRKLLKKYKVHSVISYNS